MAAPFAMRHFVRATVLRVRLQDDRERARPRNRLPRHPGYLSYIRLMHPDGESGAARAAGQAGTIYTLPTVPAAQWRLQGRLHGPLLRTSLSDRRPQRQPRSSPPARRAADLHGANRRYSRLRQSRTRPAQRHERAPCPRCLPKARFLPKHPPPTPVGWLRFLPMAASPNGRTS